MISTAIHEIDRLQDLLKRGRDLNGVVIQGLDLRDFSLLISQADVRGAVFLGCKLGSDSLACDLIMKGACIFPSLSGELPYKPYRPDLYTRDELMEGWAKEMDHSLDIRIYEHFVAMGRNHPPVIEALAQRIHDHAIDNALRDLLSGRTEGSSEKKVIGIMGGHSTSRKDPYFAKVARVARDLTAAGYFIASGGGPGMMEAANLGAWFANEDDTALEWALEKLSVAPRYTDPGYVESAFEVIEEYPDGAGSLAIPTWFYGHEPSNLFSTWIAKYFSNSIREDGLLAIATYGVIFAPGSAGTIQEVFMEATQNHYGTYRYISPMVFLGEEHYGEKSGVFSTLKKLAKGRPYEELLYLSDDDSEIVKLLTNYQLIDTQA